MKHAKPRRGTETRDRILASAADLIHERGVAATSIDDILAASDTGKSQFYLYPESEDDLVRNALQHNLEAILDTQGRLLEGLSTWKGIKTGSRHLPTTTPARTSSEVAGLGSLAAEKAERDEDLRLALPEAFSRWESFLTAGLQRWLS